MHYALWLALSLCLGVFLQHVLNAVPWDGQKLFSEPLSSWQTPMFTGVFCAGSWVVSVGIGAIFWCLLLPIVGASWAQPLTGVWKRLTTASFGGGWLFLFLCFPALPLLYAWARTGGGETDFWYNPQMWAVRMGVVCFLAVVTGGIALRVSGDGFGKTSRAVGAVGLLVFVPVSTVLGIDLWVMPQPIGSHFSMTPLIFMAEAGVAALCVATWFPVARNARLRRSLMGLLLAMLSFKVYFLFSQFLIVKYGGIPAEISFYSLRERVVGESFLCSLAVVNVSLPLLIAVVPFFRRNTLGVHVVSALCLLMTLADFYIYMAPAVPGKGVTVASALFCAASVVIAVVLGGLVAIGRKQAPQNS